ncbi:MAG: hypothetical protein ACJAQU_000327 [Loktanella salsilacus]|jgi:hypothetical protein
MTPEQALWSEVLYAAVTDAVEGVAVIGSQSADARARDTERARRYITTPNADFNQVCHLAGLDPIAVREHLTHKIANAPTPVHLAATKRKRAKLTFNGQTNTIIEWANIIGVKVHTLHMRLRTGWTPEAALTNKLITYDAAVAGCGL